MNPVDTIIRSGGFDGMDATPDNPLVVGTDVVGIVDEIGPEQPKETSLSVGDRVVGFVVPSGTHGGYSEFVTLPALSVAPIGSSIDDASAASFLSNALTAEITLEKLALLPGATFAVTGASGAVGGYLVELSAGRGLTVIADASEPDRELVARFGAAHVVRRGEEFVRDVKTLTNGVGADALYDAAILTGRVFGAVRDGGQFVYYLPSDTTPGRGITSIFSFVMRSSTRQDVISRLVAMAERGELTTRVAGSYAADAHRLYAEGGLRGRLIRTF